MHAPCCCALLYRKTLRNHVWKEGLDLLLYCESLHSSQVWHSPYMTWYKIAMTLCACVGDAALQASFVCSGDVPLVLRYCVLQLATDANSYAPRICPGAWRKGVNSRAWIRFCQHPLHWRKHVSGKLIFALPFASDANPSFSATIVFPGW